jgi:hypothetical protein
MGAFASRGCVPQCIQVSRKEIIEGKEHVSYEWQRPLSFRPHRQELASIQKSHLRGQHVMRKPFRDKCEKRKLHTLRSFGGEQWGHRKSAAMPGGVNGHFHKSTFGQRLCINKRHEHIVSFCSQTNRISRRYNTLSDSGWLKSGARRAGFSMR